jgi:hypothetical protein
VAILIGGLLGLFWQFYLRRQTETLAASDVLMTISYPPVASTRDESHIYVSVLNTSLVPVTPTVGLVYSRTQASTPYRVLRWKMNIKQVETEQVTVRSGESSFIRFPRLAPGERCTQEITLRIGSQGFVNGLKADFDLILGPGKPTEKTTVPITVWQFGLPLGVGTLSQPPSWVGLVLATFTTLGVYKTVLDLARLKRERQG